MEATTGTPSQKDTVRRRPSRPEERGVFSRLPFVDLVLEIVEFFERDIVKPTHYQRQRLYR
jgi:hypothetical protein